MDLRKLAFFHAVVTSGSFKRAAEQSNVSPPALTKGIQTLEQELGVSLFDRRRGEPSLTSAGRALLDRARRILDEADEIRVDMQRERGLESGEIRIGCGPIVMHSLLGRALASLTTQHPGVTVNVVAGNWGFLTQKLGEYALDMVAADVGDARNRPELDVVDLESEDIVWVAAPGHPLAGRPTVPYPDLISYPLALPTAPEHMVVQAREGLMRKFAEELIHPTVQSESYATLITTTKMSRCVTALPESLARTYIQNGELTVLDVPDWNMRSRPGVITLAKRPPSAARTAMIQALADASRDVARENARAQDMRNR